jgi:hypothetical protein
MLIGTRWPQSHFGLTLIYPFYRPAAGQKTVERDMVAAKKQTRTPIGTSRSHDLPYRETFLSLLYPGNYTGLEALIPAVLATEEFLFITPDQRHRIIWRTDGGFGSDDNLRWLIGRDYHIVAKGFSWKRAAA